LCILAQSNDYEFTIVIYSTACVSDEANLICFHIYCCGYYNYRRAKKPNKHCMYNYCQI